jgi:GWxTD domain-containing protein
MISTPDRKQCANVRLRFPSPFLVGMLLICLWHAATGGAIGRPLGERPGEENQKTERQGSHPKGTTNPCEHWLTEEIPYIISDEEKRWSAKLKTDQDCERFIKDFWERRNPDPGSPQNKFKEQYYKRVAYAKDHFHYLSAAGKDDRARIYILFGPPDRIESPVVGAPKPSSGAGGLAVKERWIYNEIEGIGENVPVEFTDPDKSGEYRLVTDPMTLFRPAA